MSAGKITHMKTVARTPAMPFLVRAWHELNEAGHSDNSVLIYWDDEVLTYEVGGTIVGIISFMEIPHMKELFVRIGFVDVTHRGTGVYSALWKHLVGIAAVRGIPFISGGRHIRNVKKSKVDKRMGRADLTVGTIYAVPLLKKDGE